MNLLPKATSDFTQIDYWDKFFKKRGKKAFEWYGEYPELCGILHKYIWTRDKILVIGCGNSTLSSDLFDVGYKNIVNIDTSAVVIKQMKAKHKGKKGLEYHQMDATNVDFKEESFSVVLDKGTLDALMPDSSSETLEKINKLFDEIDRVLMPLGRYVCISLLQQHILNHLLRFFSSRGWLMRICRCEEAEKSSVDTGKGGFTFPVFVIICTKLRKSVDNKPVFEVIQSGETIVRMATLEDTAAAVKSMQDTALVCSGLNRCSLADTGEVTVELSKPADKYPRYTVTVVDSPNVKDTANMKFAAFIVPQGREREWLFATPEGRQVLVESSGFDRLAVVRLHREHKYENLKATQDETADTILKLAPSYKGTRPKIPFLSVAADLGNVKEIARGESEISGGFIIEDAEGADNQLFRRLVFLSNQNVVQSEAKLKKVDRNGEVHTEIDVTHLACDYHMYMTLGVSMVATDDLPFHALVIGLGGGGLCTYIRNCFPTIRITAIDIDPVILDVATKYFGFKQDDQIQVIIQDGLDYLRTAVCEGTKFDLLLFDVDCKDSSLGLTCPPESFLEPDILQAAFDCINDRGIFLLNFVCRVKEIREKTVPKLEKLYKEISSIKLQQDVNEIFFCWKNKPRLSLGDAADKLNTIIKSRNIQEEDLIDKEELSSIIRYK